MQGEDKMAATHFQTRPSRDGPFKRNARREATSFGEIFAGARQRILAGLALLCLCAVFLPTAASAQFVCGGSATGAAPQDAQGATTGGGTGTVACGSNANAGGASVNNTNATAVGDQQHRDRPEQLRIRPRQHSGLGRYHGSRGLIGCHSDERHGDRIANSSDRACGDGARRRQPRERVSQHRDRQ